MHQGKILFPLSTQANKFYNLILQDCTGNKGKLPLQIESEINKPEKICILLCKGDKHYLCFVFNNHHQDH